MALLFCSRTATAPPAAWDGQIAAFKDRYKVIVWDMGGHGQSAYPKNAAGRLWRETRRHRRPVARRLHVASLSRPSRRTHPRANAVRHGARLQEDDAREVWNARARTRADDLDARGLAALGTSDEVRQSRHRDATGLAGAARGMLAQRDDTVIRSLEAIRVPTLVLVGANDTNFLAATDYMAAKIPGSTKVVIPDAGHAANLHQPSAFNRAMNTFLDGLAR
jgi:pimeloyl-ACP methyl ester carboxylesterase